MTHPSPTRILLLGAAASLTLTAGSWAPSAGAAPERRAAQTLEATLAPSGDPDGSGEAHFRLNKARHKVCADVTWQNIAQPDAAHIHRGSDGSIVVDLTGAVTGGAHCARGVSGRLIGKLLAHPRRFYFNVHNPDHPAGAIQGRLHH